MRRPTTDRQSGRDGASSSRLLVARWRGRLRHARSSLAMQTIAYLGPTSLEAVAGRLRAFREGLKEIGYIDGENVAIGYRFAEGQNDQLPAMAIELARRQVSVLVTGAVAAAFAAKAATTTIPIVFILQEDPVRLGIVANIPRPGGNATGINFLNGQLGAKRLELLRELLPGAVRIAVLNNPSDAASAETTVTRAKSILSFLA
jgi:putative ABC transport system substrate-binding protein